MSWTKRQINLMQEGYTKEAAATMVQSERERIESIAYSKNINFSEEKELECVQCNEPLHDPDDRFCLSCQQEQAEEFRAHREREERDTH